MKIRMPRNILIDYSLATLGITLLVTLAAGSLLSRAGKELDFQSHLDMAISLIRHHHEKWDGSGYPGGLRGDDIPLSARIMALADVYDALRTRRTYKEAFSHQKSLAIIRESSGTPAPAD